MNNNETLSESRHSDEVRQAKDSLMTLGSLAELLSGIDRVPRHINGDRENDVEHSYHLALSATEIAATYYPDLDSGLVAQFCLVHDLPEVYTGDVPTMNISSENRLKKEVAEQASIERLVREMPSYLSDLLVRYEAQVEPEARLVRYIDKIMPGIMNIIGKDVSTFLQDNRVFGLDAFDEIIKNNQQRLRDLFPELPFISELMCAIENDLRSNFF